MYALHSDANGKLETVHRLDVGPEQSPDWRNAVKVHRHPNDPDYKAFLKWNDGLPFPLGLTKLPANALVTSFF